METNETFCQHSIPSFCAQDPKDTKKPKPKAKAKKGKGKKADKNKKRKKTQSEIDAEEEAKQYKELVKKAKKAPHIHEKAIAIESCCGRGTCQNLLAKTWPSSWRSLTIYDIAESIK